MLSTVAVGTDGSATASEAVEAAIEIAQRFDAKLVLLSAFQDASDASNARDPELQWAVNQNARVREILSRTEQDLRDRKIECTSMIDEGDKTKITLSIRGREMAHQDIGFRMLERLKGDLEPYGQVEQFPKMEGRQMIMIIAPKKKK